MGVAIERYRDIMRRYRAGEFGENHLYLHQILTLGGAPDLLNEMTFDELSQLILETGDISFKSALAKLRDMKG